jgi:hypothetical protein
MPLTFFRQASEEAISSTVESLRFRILALKPLGSPSDCSFVNWLKPALFLSASNRQLPEGVRSRDLSWDGVAEQFALMANQTETKPRLPWIDRLSSGK